MNTLKWFVKVYLGAALVEDLYFQGRTEYCGVWWKHYGVQTPVCYSAVLMCLAKCVAGTI